MVNNKKKLTIKDGDQGPVVQSIVNLKTSLRLQLVKYMLTTYQIHCPLLLKKNVSAKDSHIFPTKNNSGFAIFTFQILTNVNLRRR